MHFVIHCLGMPFDGETIPRGRSLGGSESAAYYLARELAAAGHHVVVFTSHPDPAPTSDGVSYASAGTRTEAHPMGEHFEFYAEHTPHDVLIVQRIPGAFTRKWAARMCLLWLHDLPDARHRAEVHASLWQLDGVLCVSEYHRDLVVAAYGLPERVVYVLRNGVDLAAVERGRMDPDQPARTYSVPRSRRLIYTSRPERGLEHLVRPGGIMSQLPEYTLYFCTYDNSTEALAPYYAQLWEWAAAAGNCVNLGHLSKAQLYAVLHDMGAMVYPTPGPAVPDFREVSCIAVMEAAAAGLPVITTGAGALAETLYGAGWVASLPSYFASVIRMTLEDDLQTADLRAQQLEAAAGMGWAGRVADLLGLVHEIDDDATDPTSYRLERLRHSDVGAIFHHHADPDDAGRPATIDDALARELRDCYAFFPLDSYAEHYARYYDYERDRGVNYGPERLDGNARFDAVARKVGELADGATVLDYGCAHGHYTINLARRFPSLRFVGVDITLSNVIKARKWAMDEGMQNVEFIHGEYSAANGWGDTAVPFADCLIAAEVLEHMRDPIAVLRGIEADTLSPGALVLITTPFGPWEAQGYAEHWPFRAHVHDFTRARIADAFGHLPGFFVWCVPSGLDPKGEPLGSYVYGYRSSAQAMVGDLHPDAGELSGAGVRQTVSLCMIIRDEWQGLAKCLQSVRDLPDELVIAIDEQAPEAAAAIIAQVAYGWGEQTHKAVTLLRGPSPLSVGFDEARNRCIGHATGVWVLWLDADEVLHNPDAVAKYLRANALDAYSIPQHHFSLQPPALIKTDYPAKLFRRGAARFFGRVHEHPEHQLNEGVGVPFVLPDVSIAHFGYEDENVRRERFRRNLPLLVRDRQDYPERQLGRFFWLRDMAQSCRFLAERGHVGTPEFVRTMAEGFAEWEAILSSCNNPRMLLECVQFYSELVELSGHPAVRVARSSKFRTALGQAEYSISAAFRSGEEAEQFLQLLDGAYLEGNPPGV